MARKIKKPAKRLNIKNPETSKLARELAKRTGESITLAVRVALRERLEIIMQREAKLKSMRKISANCETSQRATHRSRRNALRRKRATEVVVDSSKN